MDTRTPNPRNGRLAGITLLETLISLLILGGAFIAALNTIAGARASQAAVAQQRMGLVLAEDLMAEILTHPYEEDGASLIGVDPGEIATDRSTFDDLDDYDGWSSTPATAVDGTKITGAEDYSRHVTVGYVALLSPTTASNTDEGLKLIVVTVRYGDKQVAELSTYRSDVYDLTGGF